VRSFRGNSPPSEQHFWIRGEGAVFIAIGEKRRGKNCIDEKEKERARSFGKWEGDLIRSRNHISPISGKSHRTAWKRETRLLQRWFSRSVCAEGGSELCLVSFLRAAIIFARGTHWRDTAQKTGIRQKQGTVGKNPSGKTSVQVREKAEVHPYAW